MTITTRLYTYFNGKLIGTDEFGNRYFTQKTPAKTGRTKRWVLYNGKSEPSKVPALWHGWLHYSHDNVPSKDAFHHAWEKPHLPNLTGTKNAYAPNGSLLAGGVRDKSSADYQAWTPK